MKSSRFRFTLGRLMIVVAIVAAAIGGLLWAQRMARLGDQYRARARVFAEAERRSLEYVAACKAAQEGYVRLAELAEGEERTKLIAEVQDLAYQRNRCQQIADQHARAKATYEAAARNPLRPDPGLPDPPGEDLALGDQLKRAEPLLLQLELDDQKTRRKNNVQ